MKGENVVIIGGTGSTGINLTEYLVNMDYNVHVTGFRDRDDEYYNERGVKYYSLDITNVHEFDKLPQDNIDCVILLAGAMPARMKGYDPYKYIDVNITGTLNTLEYCRKNSVGKIIYAQSHSDVSGHWNTGEKIACDAVRSLNLKGDHAVYIVSKNTAVDLIEHYHQEYGIQNIIFRLPTIYCYWPDSTMYVDGIKKEMAYLTFIDKAIKGEQLEIWGDPTIEKDIVYVKDFCQMIEKAIKSEVALGFYNVGSGNPTNLENQIKGVVEVFCASDNVSEIVYKPNKPSQTSYLYDISKNIKDLGYEPQYSYLEMLKDMKKEMSNPMFKKVLDN